MQKLAWEIANIMVDEYGPDKFLKRVSDPFWFQALGHVLGHDWHSSGVTTVVTGILKKAIIPEEHGIVVCGGKGKASRRTPEEINDQRGEIRLFRQHNQDDPIRQQNERKSGQIGSPNRIPTLTVFVLRE
jgi:hypothetical protein